MQILSYCRMLQTKYLTHFFFGLAMGATFKKGAQNNGVTFQMLKKSSSYI